MSHNTHKNNSTGTTTEKSRRECSAAPVGTTYGPPRTSGASDLTQVTVQVNQWLSRRSAVGCGGFKSGTGKSVAGSSDAWVNRVLSSLGNEARGRRVSIFGRKREILLVL
jgi:hypothetical protein